MADPSSDAADAPPVSMPRSSKPIVVGIYGIPGSGKTHLLNIFKAKLDLDHFSIFDSSAVISQIVPGGLLKFKSLSHNEKSEYRMKAIDSIRTSCAESGKVGIVAGHYMFWPEAETEQEIVCTENDLRTYTHFVYLDVSPEVVAWRREQDTTRKRSTLSVDHIRKWQEAERMELLKTCRANGILFCSLPGDENMPVRASKLLNDFRVHSEDYNTDVAKKSLDKILKCQFGQCQPKTMLVVDADRTLAPQDAGTMFWQKIFKPSGVETMACPLKELFSGPLGYSYTAFRQATLMYESAADEKTFDKICHTVASEVTMYPEFISLLHLLAEYNHIGVVVVTCGLRRVWEKVLEREGLSKTVEVIGGGRIADGFIVTAALKENIVSHVQKACGANVWAIGDSPLDLDMLKKANKAIVVVGDENERSKSMNDVLEKAIDFEGLYATQIVLPSTARSRLDSTRLPLIQLTSPEFINSLLTVTNRGLQVMHATDCNAAKVLMTPTRNADIKGPDLRRAHRRIGWYLAMELLSAIIGIEEYPIPHVQGKITIGYRLFHEKQTLIVTLMRGGEPMASGVSEAFPCAGFLHAKEAEDVKQHHLEGQITVVLVDSVVNTGKSILGFVNHIRSLHATIRIVIVAGVVQAGAVSEGDGSLKNRLSVYDRISLVALRLSENMYTGTRGTDTGNRLFNTIHIA